MANSAKVIIKQQDRSAIVPSLPGIEIGTVIDSVWGPIEPTYVSSSAQLEALYGKPNNRKGSSWNGAELLLANSNKLCISRAIHNDARYSGCLLSYKVEEPILSVVSDPTYTVDKIVKPLDTGISLTGLDSYSFPQYATEQIVESNAYKSFGYSNTSDSYNEGHIYIDDIESPDNHSLVVGDKLTAAVLINSVPTKAVVTVNSIVTSSRLEKTITLDQPVTITAGVLIDWVNKIYALETVINSTTIKVSDHDVLYDGVTRIDKTLLNSSLVRIPCVAVKTTNITLSGLQGYIPNQRVLVVGQTNKTQNGIYRASTNAWIRSPDASSSTSYLSRMSTTVDDGSGITHWKVITPGVFIVGETEIEWVQFTPLTTNPLVVSKSQVNIPTNIVSISNTQLAGELAEGSVPVSWEYIISGDSEYREAYLITAKYPGKYGDKIKIGTRNSSDYPGIACWIDVYFDDVLVESHEVSRDSYLDGYGNQMFAETKINNTSRYINILDNAADENRYLPRASSSTYWRKDETEIFSESLLLTTETAYKGDTQFRTNSNVGIAINDRIKFGSSTGFEYKVLSTTIVSGNIVFIIDRPLIEESLAFSTPIYIFDETTTDTINGIYEGIQYYRVSELDLITNLSIGDKYTLLGYGNNAGIGTILDAGANSIGGGNDGLNITVFDVIQAFEKMDNKEKYKISLFCDNGFAYPEVAQAIDDICKKTNLSHGFTSVPYLTEKNSLPVPAIIDYRNSLNLNTEYSSLFTGWVEVTDVFNQTKVWVSPSVFAINAQSFVTRNYYMFTPAAGWVYGRLNGLQITNKFEEGDRDLLVQSQVNPIRYREGYGLAVWGNETLYVKPSPLQLRSVAMLLIMLKYGLENYLEFKLFGMNNNPTWTEIETAISIFIRDTLLTPGGIYAYQVAVESIITDTDINNRICPVFVGIQPTMDINSIPVTLGIFNKSVSISF